MQNALKHNQKAYISKFIVITGPQVNFWVHKDLKVLCFWNGMPWDLFELSDDVSEVFGVVFVQVMIN